MSINSSFFGDGPDIPEYPQLEAAGIFNPVLLVQKFIALGEIHVAEPPKTIPRCPVGKKAEWNRIHPNWNKPHPTTKNAARQQTEGE